MIWENPEDPHNSGSYRSDHRQDHRDTGMPHSAQSARKQIHNSTQEIRYRGIRKDFHSAVDHFRIFCINFQNLRSEEIGTASKHKGSCHGYDNTVDQHLIHTFIFPDTIVLAGKTHTRLCHGVDRDIQETENIVGSRISRHGSRTEGING